MGKLFTDCLRDVQVEMIVNKQRFRRRAGLRHWGAPCQRVMGALPFPPLPFPLRSFPPPSPLSPSPPSRPLFCHISNLSLPFTFSPLEDKRFGAYLSQKGLLWWQQFFMEFYARIYVIFIILCTKIINLQKLCPQLSNDYIWVSCSSCCLSDYSERFGSLFPTLNLTTSLCQNKT